MTRPLHRPLGFSAHLHALVFVVVVPAIALGTFAVRNAVGLYQATFQMRLQDTAEAVAAAVDNELDRLASSLAALASSAQLTPATEDLEAFRRQAERADQHLWARGVALYGADRADRLGTAPSHGVDPAVERAFATRRQAVGNLAPAPLSPGRGVTVAVPVIRDDAVVGVVAAALDPERLDQALARGRAHRGGYVCLNDAAGATVARSDGLRESGTAAGPIPPTGAEPRGIGTDGVVRTVPADGIERLVAFHGLGAAPGWTAAVAEPWDAYAASWRRPLAELAVAGGTSMLASFFAVLWFTRRLSRLAAGLAAEAGRITAEGGAEPPPASECEELGAALARADTALRERRASERAAVAALVESEARLRALADNLPDGLIFQAVPVPESAAPWRFTHLSNGVERLHGVSAAAAVADPMLLFRRIGAGHRARFVRELARAAAARDTFRIELPFHAPSGGGLRWSRLSAAPRRLPDGTVAWDGIEVDITAAKAAEAGLRQAEERFRGLFATAPFSIVLVDPESFGVLAFNDRACDELGYTREEFAKLTIMDIDALGDMAAIRRRARAHALRPGVQEFEARHRAKDGEVRDVLVRACSVVFDGREVAYTAHHDITERKAAEAALRAGEAEFRAIFETSAAGMTEVDLRTGRYVRVNRRFCEMVGRTEADLTGGLGPDDIHHPEERGSPAGAAEAGTSPDGRFEGERRFVRPDGTAVWVRGSVAVAARDAEGRPTRAAAVVKDVTAEKLAAELQGLLMREVDHRARNALAVVRAMLRLTPAEGPDARRFAATLEGRVAAMARAHTLLSRDRWAGAELRELAEVELAPYAATGAEGGAERVRLDGPAALLVPEAAQPVGMVLHELATNAAKYGALSRPEGRVEVRWRPSAEPPGGLLVEWRESGGPALAAPPSRTGFGTRLVARTVRQLGGEAAMHWTAEGLRCSFTIPAGRFQAEAAAARAAKRGAPAPVGAAEPASAGPVA